MNLLPALLAQLLHGGLILLVAPLLAGGARWLRLRLAGRRGAPPWQEWRDLRRLVAKQPNLPEDASALSRILPYASFATALAAAGLVPAFTTGMLLAPLADLVLLAGLVGLGRAFLALAGLEAGRAQGGLAASRLLADAVLAGPALLAVVLVLSMLAGGTGLATVAAGVRDGGVGLQLPLLLCLGALLAVAQVECGAETGAMLPAEASGRHLALWSLARDLWLLFWLDLLAAVFLPLGLAPEAVEAPWLAWPLGLLAWAAKLLAVGAVFALAGALVAGMRRQRLPELLGAALLLAVLGAVLLFLGARVA